MSNTNETNLATTSALFAAFGEGDIDTILTYLEEDVVIEFYGPSTIPYAGKRNGLEEARGFFETVLASVDIHQFEPEEMMAVDDKVIVTGHLNLRAKSTGGVIDSDFVHVITLRNGKWLRFRDFMDTAAAVAAFSPN